MALDGGDVRDLGIDDRRLVEDGDDRRGPGHVRRHAGRHHPGAEQRHRIVAAARENRQPGRQAEPGGGLRGQRADHVARVVDRRQQAARQPGEGEQVVGPGARRRVHQEAHRRLGPVLRPDAGEPEVDPVLRHQHRARRREGLGVVLGDPAQLEGGPGRARRVGGQRQVGCGIVAVGEGRDVGEGALVVPERHGVAGQPAIVVDEHRAVHLAAGAERGDARRRRLDAGQHLADRLDGAVPPVGRALLGPAELRHDLRVLAAGEREDAARPVDERGADAAGAHVDGEVEVAHGLEPRGGGLGRKSCAGPGPAVNVAA